MSAATLSQYTPLESLLFFQALRTQTLTSINFGEISGELNNIPLVRKDATFNLERLTPDALQTLYLSLVKEEAKRDLEKAYQEGAEGINGNLSPGSRKRKAPSPSVPTVEAAAKHSHLLPGLLYRLYGAFRQKVVADIREDERAFDVLNREIDEIQSGDWDEKLRQQQTANGDGAPDKAATSAQVEQRRVATEDVKHPPTAPAERPRSARASIDALVNHDTDTEPTATTARQCKPSSTVTTLPPFSEMAPEHLAQDQSPNLGRATSQHEQSPHLPPPPLQPGSVYQGSPPIGHPSPYAPQYAPQGMAQGASPSSNLPNVMAGRSPSSPRRMLPLPAGMKMPTQSPPIPNGVAPYRAQPPMQPPPYPSPNQRPPQPVPMSPNGRQGVQVAPGPHMQTPQGYHPQQYAQYPAQPYTPQQQSAAQYPIRPSQQGGFQLPPFQVAAQEPTKTQHYPTPQQGRPPHPQSAPQPGRPAPYGQYSPYQQQQQPQFQPGAKPGSTAHGVAAGLTRPRRPTWKSTGPAPITRPKSPDSPVVEPMSPIRRRATLPPRPVEQKVPVKRGPGRPPRQAPQTDHGIEPPPKPEAGTKRQARNTRGNSIASTVPSSTRGRTRSQSVLSQAEAPATEKSTTARKVKNEPSTPADLLQDDDGTAEATPAAARQTRNRRGTLQSQVQASGRSNRKSSPQAADADAQDMDMEHEYNPGRRDVVYAAKNFSRTAGHLMNSINGHRHANRFQKRVNEKDAEGYFDIVKRPQDLNSVKVAIKAGTKAVAAATAAQEEGTSEVSTGTPTKDGNVITLEKTADLMPPKVIVNNQQLEKEIMRVFANAVMFNPGEGEAGDLVEHARQMADDVEANLRDVRGVETQGQEEGETTGTAKRRKLTSLGAQ